MRGFTEAASPFGVDVDAVNARLIAACPELLALVDELASACCGIAAAGLTDETRDNMARIMLRKAKAAIAKAEGRES